MTPGLKKQWCEALRSGEYKQTTKTLKDQTGYCCMGVLAHIAADDLTGAGCEVTEVTGGICIVQIEDVDNFSWLAGHEATDELPWGALNVVGLESETQKVLTQMNDGSKPDGETPVLPKSFAEIADWIDANL